MQMRIVFISVVAALLLLAGCGSDDEVEGGEGATVVATTGILADISAEVAGPDATVEQLIPDGASPHDFSASADDRARLEEADLVVADGAGLEVGLPLDEVDSPLWELTDHTGTLLPFEEAGAHEDEEEHGHAESEGEEAEAEEAHGDFDPHVWMDPSRVAAALPALADALADADPAQAEAFRARARDYADRLRALDAELNRTLDRIPPENRELVTSHDALGYLADRYELEVVATAFPATGPEAEASAAAIDEVIDAVREHRVPAVFAGEEDDPESLELVADETGATVVDDLIVESLGSAATYEEMLRHDAERIASALTD
jgi:zinc/manganese transport system substrate-binding protein